MKKLLGLLVLLLCSACAHPPVIPPVVDNRLPHWTDAMSDGCSTVFSLVRGHLVDIDVKLNTLTFSPAETAACVRHDHRYYVGGSEADRLAADEELRDSFINASPYGRLNPLREVSVIKARLVYDAVQRYGGPEGRLSGVSWGWGPRDRPAFEYTAAPRQEREQ